MTFCGFFAHRWLVFIYGFNIRSSMTEEIIYNNMHLGHLIDIDDFDML